jgi:hypothetical protein
MYKMQPVLLDGMKKLCHISLNLLCKIDVMTLLDKNIAVFSDVMPRNLVQYYKCIEGHSYLPDEGGRMFLRNLDKFLSDYTTSHTRIQWS